MPKNVQITALMTPGEISRELGRRVTLRRKKLKLTRAELSKRAKVSVATLGRFEREGVTTVEVLVKTLFALGAVDTMDSVLKPPTAATMAEFLKAEEE